MRTTRRGFIGGLTAGAFCSGCRALRLFEGRPLLSFGVVSDLHVTTAESTWMFRRALSYFRENGVNAVVVAGDLTDWGLSESLGFVRQAWEAEMSDTGIVPLMLTGNHDFEGWAYKDMTLDMHLHGRSEDDAMSRLGMKQCWESAFGEGYSEFRVRSVNGYLFVSAEWQGESRGENDERAAEWLEAHRDMIPADRPFFFLRHLPFPGTVSSSAGRPGSRVLAEKLMTFPNAVAFTGHTHWTLNDERSIWQGGFTALSVPSLSYTTIPYGYENGSDLRTSETKLGMSRIPARAELKEAQGFLVRVYSSYLVVERHDFEIGRDVADPWVVPLPFGGCPPPFDFDRRAQVSSVPSFPRGCHVRTRTVNADMRNGRWGLLVALTFPSADGRGGRVFDYEVRVVDADRGVVSLKRYLSPCFHKEIGEEPPEQEFLFDGMVLPEAGRFRFEVVARNCFGVESEPVCSEWLTPCPGREKSKYPLI